MHRTAPPHCIALSQCATTGRALMPAMPPSYTSLRFWNELAGSG